MGEVMQEEERIVGEVDSIFFENPSNFYKVVRITVDQKESSVFIDSELVITGQFATLQYDTSYEFYGRITVHPKYGEQFAVTRYQQITPTSQAGLIDYLSGHRFKGIGAVLAERIVDALGEDTLTKIIENRRLLDDIRGLKKEVADNLYQKLLEHEGTERVLLRLTEWGFGAKLSEKIYRQYEGKAITLIEENPYLLIEEIEGIGFARADQLAEQLGFQADAKERVIASIYESVAQITNSEGDTYVDQAIALNKAQKLLESRRSIMISEETLAEGLTEAISGGHLKRVEQSLLLPSVYHAEINIANNFQRFMEYENVERFSDEEIEEAFNQLLESSGISYDDDQIEALKLAINSPVSIITGGPGTGKTTLIKGLIFLHAILYDIALPEDDSGEKQDILLAAPTGRAAKRMNETTGLYASTIHRMIGYTRDTNEDNFHGEELEGNLLIIDEMSMVDVWLMNWLLQSVPYHMRVVFVGDQDQLPSVGPGRVFADLIESGVIPTNLLTKIYRQANDSTIVNLAHNVRRGQLPDDFLTKQHDRTFITVAPQQIGKAVSQIVSHAVSNQYNQKNLQVLAPKYKGPGGIDELNQILQAQLNPPQKGKREIMYFERLFRVGDKVLQLVNDTENGVFNGDVGEIEMILTKEETKSKVAEVVVMYDDREMTYQLGELGQITLAYCMSIHKAQGSEYPLIIMPLVDKYSRLLRKDLLYTGITRAQKSLIMIGDPESFHIAVTKEQPPRKTLLKELLQTLFNFEKAAERTTKIEASTDETDETAETTQAISNDSRETPTENGTYIQANEFKLTKSETTGVLEPESEMASLFGDELTPHQESHIEVLTMDNFHLIDPMIGMEGITPQFFNQ